MGLVDDSQMEGQEAMPFARLSGVEARQRIQLYLNSRKGTLWGQGFDLSQSESREKAEDLLFSALQEMDIVERPAGL